MRQSFTVAVLLALVATTLPASAQRSALIPATVHDAFVNEISGDISFEHIRWFTHYHRPMGGGEGFEAVAKYVEQKAREYGLEDVRVIRQKSSTPSRDNHEGAKPRWREVTRIFSDMTRTEATGHGVHRAFASSRHCDCACGKGL